MPYRYPPVNNQFDYFIAGNQFTQRITRGKREYINARLPGLALFNQLCFALAFSPALLLMMIVANIEIQQPNFRRLDRVHSVDNVIFHLTTREDGVPFSPDEMRVNVREFVVVPFVQNLALPQTMVGDFIIALGNFYRSGVDLGKFQEIFRNIIQPNLPPGYPEGHPNPEAIQVFGPLVIQNFFLPADYIDNDAELEEIAARFLTPENPTIYPSPTTPIPTLTEDVNFAPLEHHIFSFPGLCEICFQNNSPLGKYCLQCKDKYMCAVCRDQLAHPKCTYCNFFPLPQYPHPIPIFDIFKDIQKITSQSQVEDSAPNFDEILDNMDEPKAKRPRISSTGTELQSSDTEDEGYESPAICSF